MNENLGWERWNKTLIGVAFFVFGVMCGLWWAKEQELQRDSLCRDHEMYCKELK